jgi:hypothetical protein
MSKASILVHAESDKQERVGYGEKDEGTIKEGEYINVRSEGISG